jgi:small conductance mechanosensitive channel
MDVLSMMADQVPLPDLPPWSRWLPVLVFLVLIPLAKAVLAIVRRIWLAGLERIPLDHAGAKQRIETILAFVRSVVYFALVLLAFMYSLKALFPNFDPATATGALSILALVLTAMFRDVVVDVVKGLDILLGGHYRVGDFVRIGNFSGFVTDFQLKYTRLRSAGGEEIIINNAACIPSRRFPGGWVTNFVDIPLANPADEARAKAVLDAVGASLAELVEQVKEKPTYQLSFAAGPNGPLTLRYALKVLPGADWVITDRYLPMVRAALAGQQIPTAYDPSYFFMNDVDQFRGFFGRASLPDGQRRS